MEKEKKATIFDYIHKIIEMFSQPAPEAIDLGNENEILEESLHKIEENGRKYEDNINKDINESGSVKKKSNGSSSKKYRENLRQESPDVQNVQKRDNNDREIE